MANFSEMNNAEMNFTFTFLTRFFALFDLTFLILQKAPKIMGEKIRV